MPSRDESFASVPISNERCYPESCGRAQNDLSAGDHDDGSTTVGAPSLDFDASKSSAMTCDSHPEANNHDDRVGAHSEASSEDIAIAERNLNLRISGAEESLIGPELAQIEGVIDETESEDHALWEARFRRASTRSTNNEKVPPPHLRGLNRIFVKPPEERMHPSDAWRIEETAKATQPE